VIELQEIEEQKREGLRLLMRGFLKKKDGSLEWSGNWALTTEAFDAGDKAKFRYEMKGDSSEVEKDGKIVLMPTTALFDGSFLVKEPSAPNGFIRMDEHSVKFQFSLISNVDLKWKVEGKGQNASGEFVLEGELDGSTRRMAVFKTYMYKPTEDDSSESSSSNEDDEEEIIDPTELDDLKADQVQSYGRALIGNDNEQETSGKKKKKLRTIEE
jgi:hypothetical protein